MLAFLRRPALTFLEEEEGEQANSIIITVTGEPRVNPREKTTTPAPPPPPTTPPPPPPPQRAPPPSTRRRVKLKLRTGTGLSRAEMIMRQQKERKEEEERRRVAAKKKEELARKKEAERVARKQREEAERAQIAREEAAREQARLEEEANARRLAQIEKERRAQLEAERRARLEEEEAARRRAELQRQQQAALLETPRQSGGRQIGLAQQQPQTTSSHPERFLNQLSPQDQALFLEHFSVLNLEQQTYAYNQFLSTPPDIQKFAISQFLSLEPEVLIVSIQAEIEREAALVAEASSSQFQGGQNRPLTPVVPSFQQASAPTLQSSSQPAQAIRLARR